MNSYIWVTDDNGAAIFRAGKPGLKIHYFAVGGGGDTFSYEPEGETIPLAFDTFKGLTKWVISSVDGEGFSIGDAICVAELWLENPNDTITCIASISFNHITQQVIAKAPSYKDVVDMTPGQVAEILEPVPA